MLQPEKKYIPIEQFVQISPNAIPEGFFAKGRFDLLQYCPQYDPTRWDRDKNCYIYALDWPEAANDWIFDVGDIYAYNNQCVDLEEGSYLDYRQKQLKNIDALRYLQLIQECAQLDGLEFVSGVNEDTPASQIPMRQGFYLVVLYIDPEELDHHWYRLDNSGYWSQKRGEQDPEKTDASHNMIIDPRRANREGWTMFGGFFYVPAGGGATLFTASDSSSEENSNK